MAGHQLFFHLVWSTRNRAPMIDGPTRDFLEQFLRRMTIREGAEPIGIAILQTHIHLVVRTPTRFDLGRLAQTLKGGSSYAANRLPGNVIGLRWTRRYYVASVSPRALPRVMAYLKGQDERHPGEAIPR
jgi:REP element-mobilizing transposase RayT